MTAFTRISAASGLGLALAGAIAWRPTVSPAARRAVRAARTVVVTLQGNEFRPSRVEAHAGDSVRFVNGNGGPHNIAFAADSIAPAARALLEKAMKGEKLGPVSGPLLLDPAESYAFVVPELPAGRYPILCVPHMANMRGSLIVSR